MDGWGGCAVERGGSAGVGRPLPRAERECGVGWTEKASFVWRGREGLESRL